MADDVKSKIGNIMTPEFRVSFPAVFRPEAVEEGQEPKYRLAMLFAKDANLAPLKAACKAVLVERFGADPAKWPKGLKSPFRDQGEKEYEGYVPGCVFISASSKQKPGVVDAGVQPIIDESQFYPGCYARATVRPFYFDKKGNKGVGFGLQNVQKTRDGEPLGGRTRAENDFAPVEGAVGRPGFADGLIDGSTDDLWK